ncbi:MAG TPA: hypothetical protein VEV84_16475 [Pyrinomonadaceae bacterium]|nr:hypothetical protein [Pyrinomonadaceae bacterium]
MSKTGKVLIGVGLGLVILCFVLVVGGYFALNYIEARLQSSVKQDEMAGAEFGKKGDQSACMDEGLRRARTSSVIDLSGGLAIDTFVEACLKNAKPVKDFCLGVPGFWDVNDTRWLVEQCHRVGMDEKATGCIHVFTAKHDFCSPPK